MVSNRNARAAQVLRPLSESCLGCAECKGTCLELLQLLVLPDILTARRGNTP